MQEESDDVTFRPEEKKRTNVHSMELIERPNEIHLQRGQSLGVPTEGARTSFGDSGR